VVAFGWTRGARAADAPSATVTSSPATKKTPEAQLAEGRLAYERSDYAGAVRTIVPLLYPAITLATEDAVIEGHRLLVLSYLFLKRENEAEEEAHSILALRPSFQLDPIVDPAMAVAFFDGVRKKQDSRLRELRARERAEAEAKLREEERRRRAEAERVFVRRDVRQNSRVIATLPFGIGQWQNGQPRKAALFLSAELVFGAVSLGSYLALERKYPVDPGTNHRTYPQSDSNLAPTLLGLQLGAGIAFWATIVWGLIDAHVLYKKEVVVRDTDLGQKVLKSLRLTPSVAPDGRTGVGQVGLGLKGTF
jgi:hypothetical protein